MIEPRRRCAGGGWDGCLGPTIDGLSLADDVDDVADVGMALGIGVPSLRALSSLNSWAVGFGGADLAKATFGATRCFATGVKDDDDDDDAIDDVAQNADFAFLCPGIDGTPFGSGGNPFGTGTDGTQFGSGGNLVGSGTDGTPFGPGGNPIGSGINPVDFAGADDLHLSCEVPTGSIVCSCAVFIVIAVSLACKRSTSCTDSAVSICATSLCMG